MIFYFFIFCIIFATDGWSGPWKQSLNFTLLRTQFDQIDAFHRGLSFLERRKTESFRLSGIEDNIGNAFFYDDHRELRCRKNTRNVALASIQFVHGFPESLRSYFSHVTANDGQRFFYSSRAPIDYGNDVRKHLLNKQYSTKRWHSHYYPNRLTDTSYFEAYHEHPHAEDYVLYELSRNSERIVQHFAESHSTPTGPTEAIILHLNTRFDMCGNCAYALDWELRDRFGFAKLMIDEAHRLKIASPNLFVSAFVSSRQDFSGVWGPARRSLPEIVTDLHKPTTNVPYKFRGFNDFTSRLRLSPREDKKFFQCAVPSFFEAPSLSAIPETFQEACFRI